MHAHRPTGQWRRRFKGKDFYFGPIAKPEEALARWRAEWPLIASGKPTVRIVDHGEATGIGHACKGFLSSKIAQHERGELARGSLYDYELTCRRILSAIDPAKPLHLITAHDFDALMATMARMSPITRGVWVVRIRTVFRWVTERYGVAITIPREFRGPPMKLRRQQRETLIGKLYEPEHIHRLIGLAGPTLKAAILLGINGGYGPSDMAATLSREYKAEERMIRHRRHKTGALRRVPVWPETSAALAEARVAGSDRLLAWPNGRPLQVGSTKPLTRAFHALALAAGVNNTFYGLRYTFATVASELGDDHAKDIIMGHAIGGVPEGYVLRFPVKRLESVSEHVRRWLYQDA